ncbi:MAG: FAD-binding protein [Deltaproteobacteria bacterium]|jgi:glycolate oxidase|nr:FAD-binding protein [Deltaproteobacteria bacterium]
MVKASLLKEFQKVVGKGNVLTSETDRQSYSYDATVVPAVVPAAVLCPDKTEQLGRLVKLCYENDLPMTVRGAGTSLSGGATPDSTDSVVISTVSLNTILEVHEDDLYAVVEPGVITQQFAEAMLKRGLFYPPDPGSQNISTLAGNVAENAGGLRGLKYGVTKHYVMGMDFYDFQGELVSTGSRTVKCATGYDLSALMIGSEGTLGIISKLILKLVPPPKASKVIMAIFDDLQGAAEAVSGIIAAHVVPCTLELMDNLVINCVEDFIHAGLPRDAAAVLLIEVDGHPAQVEDDAAIVEKILRSGKVREIKTASDEEEKAKLWEGRRSSFGALARAKPSVLSEDVTVPRSKVPAMMASITEASKKFDIPIGTCGHVGDGNMHPNLLYDRRNPDENERAAKAADFIFEAALIHGGTLSGEHGIGTAKKHWMEMGVGMGNICFSRRLRRVCDPKSLFNPTKVIGV